MFDIGFQELILIFVIALLVFGPKNLPQLGRALGRAMREFRRASDEFRSTIETNLKINEPDDPLRAPTPDPAPEPSSSLAEPGSESLPESRVDPYGGGEVAAEAAAPSGEAYLTGRGSRLFHGRGCTWVRKIEESERTYFKHVAEAREAGFLPCPSCEPWEPG